MKREILIVDDEPGFTQTIKDYFKTQGYRIHAAHDAGQALDIFREIKPKVVLLDYSLPTTTGDRFLPLLQSLDPLVRVIVITGFASDQVEEKFKGMGYFAYFEKASLSLEKVKDTVEEALKY